MKMPTVEAEPNENVRLTIEENEIVPSSNIKVKVLSLNMWGIPGISKNRCERLDALAEQLVFEEPGFDFVCLQELWSESDFRLLVERTEQVLPYNHYFHSGVMGSGVCFLSKWPIIDIFSFKYNLNGYAHKFHHGDWFGGKVVGMAKVQQRDMIVNVYVTHLHAEYDRLRDAYLYHRVSQAFEFSQFVSHTSLGSCDYAIVAGDFNTQPDDLPYRIILYNSRLKDSFCERKLLLGDVNSNGASCGHPRNSYTAKSELRLNPSGQRIDYILYGEGTAKVNILCESYDSPAWKTKTGVPISDHEPVVSVLQISKSVTCHGGDEEDPMAFVNFFSDANLESRIECLTESVHLMNATLTSMHMNRLFFYSFGIFTFVVMLGSFVIDTYVDGTYVVFLHIFRLFLTVITTFCFLMGLLLNPIEKASILSAKESMDMLLRFLNVQSDSSLTRSIAPV